MTRSRSAEPAPAKSTNVRITLPWWFALPARGLAAVSPELAVEHLTTRFLRTTRRSASPAAERFRRTGERFDVRVDGVRAVGRAWGDRGPTVLLLHGWNGAITDFRHVVPALLARGLRAVAVECPGHGDAGGDVSNVLVMARTLSAAARVVGPAEAVVAHSLGAAAAGYALANGQVAARRAVLVASAVEPAAWPRAIGDAVQPGLGERMVASVGRRVGVPAAEAHLGVTLPRLAIPVALIHDRGDAEARFDAAVAVAERLPPGALHATQGLGHRRILADTAVVRAVAELAAGGAVEDCFHGELACERCALEHDLYDRSHRAA